VAPWKVEEVTANRAGLRKVTKSVRGKKGTVRRSYWVKSQGAANKPMTTGNFVKKHAGKLAVASLIGGAASGVVNHQLVHRGVGLNKSAAAVLATQAGFGHVAVGNKSFKRDMGRMSQRSRFGIIAGATVASGIAHTAGFIASHHYTR